MSDPKKILEVGMPVCLLGQNYFVKAFDRVDNTRIILQDKDGFKRIVWKDTPDFERLQIIQP